MHVSPCLLKVLLGSIAVPIFGAILGVVKSERSTERERMAQQLHVDFFARICLDREIHLAEAIDTGVSCVIPRRIRHFVHLFDFDIVELDPALLKTNLERNVVEAVTLLVGKEKYEVISNAAWKAPSGSLSTMFQAGALIELSGDKETAWKIYYDEYDIHELPPLS